MNKYQEAYNYIVVASNGGNGIVREINILKELVDRATPMKPKGSLCAVCNELVFEDDYYCDYKHTYCPNCGQAIDWGVEID